MTLTPAYGRDYKNKKSVLEDFNSEKDFIIADITNQWSGKPVNKQQLNALDYPIYIRYNKLQKVLSINL